MDELGLFLATLAVSAAGGLVPLINVEAWVLAVSAMYSSSTLVPVALAATAGQVGAKVLLYKAGGGARSWGARRGDPRLGAVVARMEGRSSPASLVVFASAVTGVPPFYVVSLAAGVVRFDLPRFVALALLGRFLRFAAVFVLPQVLAPGLE